MLRFSSAPVVAAVFLLAWTTAPKAQEGIPERTALQILELIEANGNYAYAAAAADIQVARSMRDQATAALYPRLSLDATGQRFLSTVQNLEETSEIYGKLEVVQPIYDFGKSGSEIDAANSDVKAAEQALITARNTVLLEGLALFYELHASELQLRAYNENHASAYVRWDRVKEKLGLGSASPVDVAKSLVTVEKTRLEYYRERARNNTFRLRLEELIGQELPEELILAPKPPAKAPLEVDRTEFGKIVVAQNPEMMALLKQVEAKATLRTGIYSRPDVEAFGNVGHSSRDTSGRHEYAVGARLSWPIFDGGIKGAQRNRLAAEESRLNALVALKGRQLRLKAHTVLMERDNSYQRVVSAKAGLDYARKNLLRRQQLYSQERVADLGRAMIENSQAEAEMIRAIGAYNLELARIAMMLGENPGKGLEEGFLASVMGDQGAPAEGYVPKGGSGYGQDDQDKVNRNIE